MSSAKRSREEKPGFNIILLGNSGTGKSASGNTLLRAGKCKASQHFASYPSSTPVTTTCKEIVVKMFGRHVGVVDTPDFFYEDKPVDAAQIQKCKKYCETGQYVMLLVIQLGRFTDGERGILEKLESTFGWEIRKNTIVLFTHGEDLHCDVRKFIGEQSHLGKIVEACGKRIQEHRQRLQTGQSSHGEIRTHVSRFQNKEIISAGVLRLALANSRFSIVSKCFQLSQNNHNVQFADSASVSE